MDVFKEDPKIATGSATALDYYKTGYDRGHLAPAADMCFSEESMSASFFFSNISPQAASFNRGIWAKLEKVIRNWAVKKGSIVIITGPVLTKEKYNTIGENQVSIPEFCYKVVIDHSKPNLTAIAFLLPNEGSSKSLHLFSMSIDDLEKLTSLDFCYKLDDLQETALEQAYDIQLWDGLVSADNE